MKSFIVQVRGVNVRYEQLLRLFLFSLVTFGLYGLLWYYRINREFRDIGQAVEDDELGRVNPFLELVIFVAAFWFAQTAILVGLVGGGIAQLVAEAVGLPSGLSYLVTIIGLAVGIFALRFVSMRITSRVRTVQGYAAIPPSAQTRNGVGVLLIVLNLFWPLYIQAGLNRAWLPGGADSAPSASVTGGSDLPSVAA